MTTREHINEYFNSKSFMVLCALVLIATAVVARLWGITPPADDTTGIFFTFTGPLINHEALSWGLNLLCLLATGGILLALNKVFAFVRSVTHLFVSAFFLLQTANPQGLVAFNAGTLLCLTVALALLPLFAAYQDRHSQRRIFLIFALAMTGCLFHYGFLILIPAFLLGFLNMGALNLKGVLALLFGLVTPLWIVLGLGLADPMAAVLPQWTVLGRPALTPFIVLVAITSVLGIVLAVMNLHTLMNYRMQTRVYNAFFIIMLVLAVIALCLSYRNPTVFLPLLNLMVAIQVAHAYTLRGFPYRYIFLLLFIAGCVGFCAIHLFRP